MPEGGGRTRAALTAFGAVELGALVYYVALARSQWFFADEWEFLSARGIRPGDLLDAHYGHWVAVPVVVYRVLWQLVGLRSYLPYVGVAIVLHLVAGGLLLVVMRRAGVRPWTATLAASVFVLFGSGAQDVLWAFQITFTGALVLGLVQLLLADHDGGVDVRDAGAVAAGLLAVMCSGVAVTMVLVAAVATLLRRSWRVALLQLVPLGVYGVWWLHYSHGKYAITGSVRQAFDWCVSGAAGTFGALGRVPGVGWLVAAVLVAGAVLAVRERGLRVVRGAGALPAALLFGALVFLVVAAIDRSGVGAHAAQLSRYLHVMAALVLPAIAVAVDALLTRARVLGVLAVVVLLVGVPGNVLKARDYARSQRPVDDATREIMLSVAHAPIALGAPARLRPEPNRAPTVTMAWLRDAAEAGKVPSPRPPTAVEQLTDRLRLTLMELDERSGLPCTPLRAPVELHLRAGQRVGIVGKTVVVLLDGTRRSAPVAFGVGLLNPALAHTLQAVTGPLTIRIGPGGRTGILGPAVCTAPKA